MPVVTPFFFGVKAATFIRKVCAVWAWLSACSSVISTTSGKAARSPAEISASAASSASVTGELSPFAFTSKSGPS